MFGHAISTVPPAIIRPFAEARDAAVVLCLEAIQEHEVFDSSTHALPAGAGGASLRCALLCNMGEEATSVRITELLDPSLPEC